MEDIELVLSCINSLQIYLLHPFFAFFSGRSPAMPLKKDFDWAQNLKFSLELNNSRRVHIAMGFALGLGEPHFFKQIGYYSFMVWYTFCTSSSSSIFSRSFSTSATSSSFSSLVTCGIRSKPEEIISISLDSNSF